MGVQVQRAGAGGAMDEEGAETQENDAGAEHKDEAEPAPAPAAAPEPEEDEAERLEREQRCVSRAWPRAIVRACVRAQRSFCGEAVREAACVHVHERLTVRAVCARSLARFSARAREWGLSSHTCSVGFGRRE